MEEVQHLSRAIEADDPVLLLDSKCRYPDWNESILTEGQTESRMPRNLQEELAVAPGVGELTFGRRAKGKAAEHERASVVSESLLAALSFFADEGNGLQLAKPELCEANRGQNGLKGSGQRNGSGRLN